MSETHSVKRHLDVEADAYDVQIRRFIPHYDDMLATAVELLGSCVAPNRVCSISAAAPGPRGRRPQGPPAGSRLRARRRPGDARRRAGAPGRFRRLRGLSGGQLPRPPSEGRRGGRLARPPPRPRPRPQDGSLPGGSERPDAGWPILNLDAAVSEGPRVNRLIFDRLAAHLGEQGIPDAEARAHFAAWAEEDRYFPLDAELAALRRAGFAEVECFWRRGISAICCGLRAA